MNHWSIKDFGKHSSYSGDAFVDGSEVVCLVLKSEESSELIRCDILKSESDLWKANTKATLLGKWERIFSEKAPEGLSREERKESAESFFLSLFDQHGAVVEERELLCYLFAISLERKRVLKSSPMKKGADFQEFTHIKTKRIFEIPIVIPEERTVHKIESIIGELLF